MRIVARCWISILLSSGLLGWNIASAEQVIGWVNSADIYPEGIRLHARMDTGAKTSSLRGKSSKNFIRNGEPWISINITDKSGHMYTLEHRVIRITKIKRHNGKAELRPIIALGICVSDVYQEVEVTIADEAAFNYPLLIGRNFLAGNFLVDSGKTFSAKPQCKNVPK
jgi:hypothetical protein